ncbi:hypothetical protein K2173_015161 [Erythroxylum novogranatense]|uniref:TOD1/MUCI70 glycosyltransferase-like domain-containing protein n=1 Tax=Erythroxylum novogranatense TaxID=1862640 RepID=A0AAV8T2F9_9ROSI|nr:hypothetical protein K2173_015161 [Erythroxylum novogranatense]
MAQYRQSGLHFTNGTSDHVSVGIRPSSSSHQKPSRSRRSSRSDKGRSGFSIGSVILILCLVFSATVLAYYYLSTDNRGFGAGRDEHQVPGDDDDNDIVMSNDLDFLTNVTRTDTFKVVGFGKGSVAHGRDSRYWDRDDRRRDEDYNGDEIDHTRDESTDSAHIQVAKVKNAKGKTFQDDKFEDLSRRGVGLYNEDGRKELKRYEKEYEASLQNVDQLANQGGVKYNLIEDENDVQQNEEADSDNDYDDGIDSHDPHLEERGDSKHDNGENSGGGTSQDDDDNDGDGNESNNFFDAHFKDQSTAKGNGHVSMNFMKKNSILDSHLHATDTNLPYAGTVGGLSSSKSRPDFGRKRRRRKFSGSSCEMKFLNSTAQLVEPFENRKFARFSLQYIEMEKPNGQEQWKPRFAGHQSLQDREETFLVHDQKMHCGFVRGPEGSQSTGFDLAEDDLNYISRCHIAVVSCIFGNSDRLRSPTGKTVTRLSRKNVCFVMFMDEVTLQTLSSEGQMPDRGGFIGLWKIVVVKNLPYADMRRVGKIPKLLPHRLFPSARYSIWLDSKLRLQRDPLIILEYLLWRKGHEYAISNHYDRHCVWEEVAQNKRLNKYNHTVIDQQFAFYKADGLNRFNASDPNRLLPSNVPEGSLIVRAHTPTSNLFSCLWFNEVDRFTSRDQLSFAYTYQKLRRMNPAKPFYLNMFKDCERRAIAKLYRHRIQEKRNSFSQATE